MFWLAVAYLAGVLSGAALLLLAAPIKIGGRYLNTGGRPV